MVYVDRLQRTRRPPKQAWLYYNFCHLTADSREELISFAEQLGLKEEYIQISRNGTPIKLDDFEKLHIKV